jgi:hypothetical protein
MADDINPARRAELEAHRAFWEPILRGLMDDELTLVSPRLKETFKQQIVAVRRRLTAVDTELANMDRTNDSHQVLLDDGYPNTDPVTIDPALFDELQRENADREAAAGMFRSAGHAATLAMTFGEPQPKT